MEKQFIFLCFILTMTGNINAQNQLADFEDGGITPAFTTVGVTASLGIIDNPDNDGNSTNKVLYAKTNNVAGDASIDIVFNNSFIVNGETRYLHLLLKTNIPVYELNVRKKDGTFAGAGLVNLPAGGWFDYVLDLNSVNGTDLQGAEISSIRMRLYTHLDDQLNRDFYFDEIIVNNTAAQRIADVNGAVQLSGFEAGEYMPPFYTYWYETTQSNSTVAVVDNPVKNDINPSDKVLKIDETNASFPLLRINIPFKKQVLITDANKYLHFYALSSSSPCIFVGNFPDEVWINGTLTPNQWTDVVIDLSAYKGKTIGKIELVPNVSSGTPPVAYIDNIEMSDRARGRDMVDSFLDDIACSVTLPDNDWTFTDTAPSAEVTVKNPTAAEVSFKLICDVYTDVKEAFDKKEVEITLAPGESRKETFTLENAQPDFYRYYIDLAAGAVTRNKFCRVIAYKPGEIPVTVDAKPDFWEFWDAAIAELANTEPDFKVTQRSSTTSRIVYDVEMTSLGGYLLKGYYSVPNKAGTFPAIVLSNGYGVAATISDRNDDYIEFNYNVRGQGISNTSPFSEDWVVAGLSDKATYYYRNAYMDALRAVDFVCSRPEVNRKLLFAEGSSQGGALTYVIGALDRRVKGIVPEIPFMSDFENYYLIKMNTGIDKWPMNLIDAYGNSHSLTHEQVFETLSYFDLKNMMEKVTAPVLMGIGLQDPVCPPHINFAAYNRVTSEKEYHVCAICEHESGSAFNNTIKPQWYKNRIEKFSETGISSIANQGISVGRQGSQIVIEGNTAGLLQIEAYSMDGLKLFSEKASVPYHKTLKKGIYILRITTATGTVCEKILIQ
jgi:cephalosporin-C deacetylase-like acetyl esterase